MKTSKAVPGREEWDRLPKRRRPTKRGRTGKVPCENLASRGGGKKGRVFKMKTRDPAQKKKGSVG